jgi:hypothetical protein
MQGFSQPNRPQPIPHLSIEPEELLFTLDYAGRPAGNLRWTRTVEKGLIVVRLEANFSGIIGQVRRVQTSRIDPRTMLPVLFTENNGSGGSHFEANFDRRAGLVTIRQNRDEASQALTQDYHDPLSIIQFLRDLPDDASGIRIPMVGGNIMLTRLPDELIQTPSGEKTARVYYLRPGVGLVYLEADAPHRPLRFSQAVGRYMLEAILSRISSVQVSQPGRQDRNRGQQTARGRVPNVPQPTQRPTRAVQPAKGLQVTRGTPSGRFDQGGPRQHPRPPHQQRLTQNAVNTEADAQVEGRSEGRAEGNRRRRRRSRRRGKGGGNAPEGSGP